MFSYICIMFEVQISLPNKRLKATWQKHDLIFKRPAKTSRETFKIRDTYLLKIEYIDEVNQKMGIGECSPLWTLCIDSRDSYSEKLDWVCANINRWDQIITSDELSEYPSIQFGLETALLDLQNGGVKIIFPGEFTEGKTEIEINGLIWMGDFGYMSQQIEEKLAKGFKCVKLKIGAIDWEEEKQLLRNIRGEFSAQEIELRVDANGAFSSENALEKLRVLADLKIHSIEQPIMAGKTRRDGKIVR